MLTLPQVKVILACTGFAEGEFSTESYSSKLSANIQVVLCVQVGD